MATTMLNRSKRSLFAPAIPPSLRMRRNPSMAAQCRRLVDAGNQEIDLPRLRVKGFHLVESHRVRRRLVENIANPVDRCVKLLKQRYAPEIRWHRVHLL